MRKLSWLQLTWWIEIYCDKAVNYYNSVFISKEKYNFLFLTFCCANALFFIINKYICFVFEYAFNVLTFLGINSVFYNIARMKKITKYHKYNLHNSAH
jgi:hypothetical protein